MNKKNATTNSNDFHLLRFYWKAGNVLTVHHLLSCNSSMRNSPIFQMCKPRLREVKSLAQGEPARKWFGPRMPLSPPSLPTHTAGKEQGGGGELAFVLFLLSTQTLFLVLPHASELLQGKEFLCSCPPRAVKVGRVEGDLESPNSMLISAHKAHASEGERVTCLTL